MAHGYAEFTLISRRECCVLAGNLVVIESMQQLRIKIFIKSEQNYMQQVATKMQWFLFLGTNSWSKLCYVKNYQYLGEQYIYITLGEQKY